MSHNYHIPVMLTECIDALQIKQAGTYVDVTFGGGGHSSLILDSLSADAQLFAFDRDADANDNANDDARFTLIHQDYRHLARFMKLHRVKEIDGLLADLGISSYQIDTGERGFSVRFEGPLDMRMDTRQSLSAADVLNTYNERDLVQVFSEFGEVRNSKTLAAAIVDQRLSSPFETTMDLIHFLEQFSKGNPSRYYAQVFQAIRIEVNKELDSLKEMLSQASALLAVGGRLVILTYHSLEDRIVKNFFRTGNFEGVAQKDFYGNILHDLKLINNKPILPTEEEVKRNPRARSAKLRIVEKVA